MVRRIEGTIDYEKHSEILNDNHKVLIYLDDMTLTGKFERYCTLAAMRSSTIGCSS